MRDPISGVTLRFVRGEGNTLTGEPGNATASEYIAISRQMTTYAYDSGLLSESDNSKLVRQAARRAIGTTLRNAREKHGLSIRDVEERTGISKNIICRTEAGRSNTTIDTISILADCYGLMMRFTEGGKPAEE